MNRDAMLFRLDDEHCDVMLLFKLNDDDNVDEKFELVFVELINLIILSSLFIK